MNDSKPLENACIKHRWLGGAFGPCIDCKRETAEAMARAGAVELKVQVVNDSTHKLVTNVTAESGVITLTIRDAPDA